MGDLEVSFKFEISSLNIKLPSATVTSKTRLLFSLVISVSLRDGPKHLNKNILSQKEK